MCFLISLPSVNETSKHNLHKCLWSSYLFVGRWLWWTHSDPQWSTNKYDTSGSNYKQARTNAATGTNKSTTDQTTKGKVKLFVIWCIHVNRTWKFWKIYIPLIWQTIRKTWNCAIRVKCPTIFLIIAKIHGVRDKLKFKQIGLIVKIIRQITRRLFQRYISIRRHRIQ